jgi:hypothetical protein
VIVAFRADLLAGAKALAEVMRDDPCFWRAAASEFLARHGFRAPLAPSQTKSENRP